MEMFVFNFFILASLLAGCYCMSYECYSQRLLDCGDYDIAEQKLPETTEDIQNFCNEIIPLGRCMIGVMEKCAKDPNMHDDVEDVENLKEVMKYIEASCDEDSDIFKVITNNLRCVTSTLDSAGDFCHWVIANDTTRERLLDLVDVEHEGCVIDSWMFYCITARFVVECGNDVGNAVSEILDNTEYASKYCKEVRSRLIFIEDAIQSEFERVKIDEDALPGIFEAIGKKVD